MTEMLPVDHDSDNSLIASACAGDRDALSALLARHRPVMVKHLQRYPLSPGERQDALQDALLQIVRRLGSFRGDSRFSTWVYRVTANAGLLRVRERRVRRSRTADEIEVDEHVSDPQGRWCERADVRMHDQELRQSLARAIAVLEPQYRAVVRQHYVEGLSLEAIAQSEGASEKAVRSRLHRARTHLRHELLPLFGGAPRSSAA